MDAILSGHARVAFLLDGERLASLHAGATGEVVPRQPAEIRHLLAGAEDLELLRGVSLDEVGRRLEGAVERIDSLHLALILLDHELSEETRRQAASDLEESLGDEHAWVFLNRIFAGAPLPAEADLVGARAVLTKKTEQVRRFLNDLEGLHDAVVAIHIAWEGIPERRFADQAARRELRRTWTREGLFLGLAQQFHRGKSLSAFLGRSLLKPALWPHRALLRDWVRRLDDPALSALAAAKAGKAKKASPDSHRGRASGTVALDLDLRSEPGNESSFLVRAASPAGQASGQMTLSWRRFPGATNGRTLPHWDLRSKTYRTFGPKEASLQHMLAEGAEESHSLGEVLFTALFRELVLDLFDQSLDIAESDGSRLPVRLHFDPTSPGHSRISSLPWELLARPGGEPLCLDQRTPVLRFIDAARPAAPTRARLKGPLRTLVVASCPERSDFFARSYEQATTAGIWGREAGTEVELLSPPTPAALESALRDRDFHVVHFIGHGTLESQTGEWALIMEDDHGQPATIAAAALARHMDVPHRPALAILNACTVGRSLLKPDLGSFTSIAAALVKGGLPAIVAMQFPLSQEAAWTFSMVFYQHLAIGDPIEAAVTAGRIAMQQRTGAPSLEWAAPALFVRARAGRTFAAPPKRFPPAPRGRKRSHLPGRGSR